MKKWLTAIILVSFLIACEKEDEPLSTKTVSKSICANQLPFIFDGVSYNTAGIYTDTVAGNSGRDTVVTINLSITSLFTKIENVTICDNQLPYKYNGITYTAAGTYTNTVVSTTGGCDTMVTINLNIACPPKTKTELLTLKTWIYEEYYINYGTTSQTKIYRKGSTQNIRDYSKIRTTYHINGVLDEIDQNGQYVKGAWRLVNNESNVEITNSSGVFTPDIISLTTGRFEWYDKTNKTYGKMIHL